MKETMKKLDRNSSKEDSVLTNAERTEILKCITIMYEELEKLKEILEV